MEDARKNALAVGRNKGKEIASLFYKFAVAEVGVPHLLTVNLVCLKRHDEICVVCEVLFEPCKYVCCVVLLFFEADVSLGKLAYYLTYFWRISCTTENADVFYSSFNCRKNK